MKKILILFLLLFAIIACRQTPYWKTQSFGLIDSICNDTLKIENSIRESFYLGHSSMKFFTNNNFLFALYEENIVFYNSDTDRCDTIILWKNTPIDISNNKRVLDQYKSFEHNFRNWKDSLHNCSATHIFTIYFKEDTSSVVDRSGNFYDFLYLSHRIQESTKPEDIYSITPAQADSIHHVHYPIPHEEIDPATIAHIDSIYQVYYGN